MLSHSTPRGLGRWDSAAKTVPPFHAWGLERWNGAAKTVPPFHALGFGTLERLDPATVPGLAGEQGRRRMPIDREARSG